MLNLAACGEKKAEIHKPPATVATVVVALTPQSSSVSLTGEIRARVQSDLSFRVAGRVASRLVEVGEHVSAGQVLATLETTQQDADISAAKAGIQAAEANVGQLQAAFDRQTSLLAQGFTTQSKYDDAKKALIGAQTSLESSNANLATAQDQLNNATLKAPSAGVITARLGEVGQVIDQAKAMYSFAADGDRDAVFDVYESLITGNRPSGGIQISPVSNPSIKADGVVREVAPAIDPVTGTIRVKIGIKDTPPEMRLGAAVIGVGQFRPRNMVSLPWTAFFANDGKPAVWIVDPKTSTVSLRNIEVQSYRTGGFLVQQGLATGDIVVVAGAQLLWTGEHVDQKIAGAS